MDTVLRRMVHLMPDEECYRHAETNPFWQALSLAQRALVVKRRFPAVFARLSKDPRLLAALRSELIATLVARGVAITEEEEEPMPMDVPTARKYRCKHIPLAQTIWGSRREPTKLIAFYPRRGAHALATCQDCQEAPLDQLILIERPPEGGLTLPSVAGASSSDIPGREAHGG